MMLDFILPSRTSLTVITNQEGGGGVTKQMLGGLAAPVVHRRRERPVCLKDARELLARLGQR